MLGGIFGKKDAKVFKVHVQNVRLPPLDIIDEGDEISVFLEKGENYANTTEKPLHFLRSGGDMGADFDEDIKITVHMKKSIGGEYKEKMCDLSVRKRKKGIAGKKEGPDAYRILAWTTIDVKKYADNEGKEMFISSQLNWTENGEDFLGKGALLNAKVMVEECPDDEDDGKSVTTKTTTTTTTATTTANKASKTPAKPVETAISKTAMNKSVITKATTANKSKSPWDDDDEDDEDVGYNIHKNEEEEEEDEPINAKNKGKTAKSSANTKNKDTSDNDTKKKPIHNNKFFFNEDGDNANGDDDDNDDDESPRKSKTTTATKKSTTKQQQQQSAASESRSRSNSKASSSTRAKKTPVKGKYATDKDDDDDEADSGDGENDGSDYNKVQNQLNDIHFNDDNDDSEMNEESNVLNKYLSKSSTKPSSTTTTTATTTANNNNGGPPASSRSVASSSSNQPPVPTYNNISGTNKSVGSSGGVMRSESNASLSSIQSYTSTNSATVGGQYKSVIETPIVNKKPFSNNVTSATKMTDKPVFLGEFKDREYHEGASHEDKNDFSSYDYIDTSAYSSYELGILKKLEAAKLENVRLRQAVISYEMQLMKYNFFNDEVIRLQELVHQAEAENDKLVTEKNELSMFCKDKVDENTYIVDELLKAKNDKMGIQSQLAVVKNELDSLKHQARQDDARRPYNQRQQQDSGRNGGGGGGGGGFF